MENKKIKILAIDDNKDNLITLKAIISEALPQSVVYMELSGQGGIESARTNEPDVILLDIVMPGMDGYQVCKTLKADEQLSETPIIFLTALKGDKQSRILALEAGGEAFLAKPIDVIELKAQIHAMLKIKEAAALKRDQKLQLEALVQKRTEELTNANIASLNLLEDLNAEIEIRKQRELELIKSEEKFSVAFKTSPYIITITNLEDGRFFEVNYAFFLIMGYTPEETLNNYSLAMDLWVNVEDRKSVVNTLIGGGQIVGQEFQFKNKNGEILTGLYSAHLIEIENKTYILSSVNDITSRKKAEEINKKLLNQLELISLHLPGVIFQFRLRPDGSFHFPYASPGIYNIYGVQPKDVEHDATIAYKAIHPDDLEQVTLSINHSAQTLTPWHDIYRINQSSGKTIWVEGNSTPQKLEDGSINWYGFIQDISERKIAEEALRESQIKLKRILSNLQDAYLQADLDGNITFANTTAAKIYGYANIQEMIGLPTSNLYKDKVEREKLIVNLSKSEKLTDIIGEGLKNDGTTFWVSISVQSLKDNQGKKIGTEGLIRDITNRRISEEQILKLSRAVEQSPASIILTDIKGNVEYANPKTLEITGYSLEEVKGKNPRIFSSGEKPKNEYENLWETILSGKEWRGEFHNKKKSGELYWELASISPIINEKGEIINLLAVKEDITERKQILDDLTVAKEKTEESEIRLLEAQKITKVGSWETDLSNHKIIWSDETYRIFEINANIFQATHQAFLNFVHPDDKKIVSDAFAKSFETNAYNSIEHRIITAKGTIKYVEERWKIVFNEEEKPTQAIGTCQDITERKQAEQLLKEAKEHAEQSDNLKSAFLANMSHEIRTPMNGILGFAALLKEPGLSGEKQQKYIKIIEKSGDRMLNIINDIVDISKIESGTIQVYITETNVNEKIENLFNFFKPETDAKNIHFSVEKTLPKNEAIIKTDSEKVYAILTNLLKNAIKFTNEGKIEFGVEYTRSLNEQKQLKFFIKDTGMGIPKDRQQAIFERFIQADIYDKMALQGAGLGLSIAKAYVELMGGKIWVESEEGIGSAFYFTIPYNNEMEKVFIQDADESTKADVKAGNLKILIAEDDEASQMLASTIVETYVSEIFIANDGMEAVEIYKNNPDIDLILMDIQMPKLNGYEATRQIRQLNKKVVIIAQTAYALSYDRQKVIDAGCNDYISKPILIHDLKTLIKKYFNN